MTRDQAFYSQIQDYSPAQQAAWTTYLTDIKGLTLGNPTATKSEQYIVKHLSNLLPSTLFNAETQPFKTKYNYSVMHGETKFYFEYGIAPLCIFCAAIFSVFWGTLAGLLIKKINMDDPEPIQNALKTHFITDQQREETGAPPQANEEQIMKVLKLVGEKITEGAKAFLYKEYIWLTIWSCSFAIVLGSTVDLLEMSMKRAPTNFPYTATSYLTGSMTSILAGYIGMRIAVYTNTRVTYTCCSSVHRGFITAFRGGQVLGFCLVGLAILNIMIIILLFKACWYNQQLEYVLQAGRPINNCPTGEKKYFLAAQAQIWAQFEETTHALWAKNFAAYHSWGITAPSAAQILANKKDDLGVNPYYTLIEGTSSTSVTAAEDVTDKWSTMAIFKKAIHYYDHKPVTDNHYDCDAYDNNCKTYTAETCVSEADHQYWENNVCNVWYEKDLCSLWTATTSKLPVANKGAEHYFAGAYKNCESYTFHPATTGNHASYDTNPTAKTWGDAMLAYQTTGTTTPDNHNFDNTGANWTQGGPNDMFLHETIVRGATYDDHFLTIPYAGTAPTVYPRGAWIWSNSDQLNCEQTYNAEFYKFKQRVCVLTRRLFELIAGYGLGGSSVALFGRVGGGIYTKAADVGADLVGKTIQDLKEDDITNPGTIADNVGDNVGDIAGMGSDLFGSLAESTCAALVVSATSYELVSHPNALFFPIAITSSGMIASWLSVLLAHLKTVTIENVQGILKFQVGASTIIMTGCVIPAVLILPEEFTFEGGAEKVPLTMHRWTAYGCVMFGLWSGMIIGFITEYYTNNAYAPTKWLADACNKGPAPNIILGLALGYVSVVIPIICITATIGYGFANAGMYGIGLSALGMLGSLPVALSVDGYGPISDNAGGCAEMSGLPAEIRDLTDALDAAGNTTAAVGKGFAIGSACLVGLALFGAFITRIGDTSVDILKPTQFAGLLIGAMLPYFFTALTMRAVGDAAYQMMDFIQEDYDRGQRDKKENKEYVPDYEGCIKISTEASLRKMVAPGVLVIGSPLLAGFIFGPNATAGVLAGAIVSGVQVAISQSNSGGAWDNAKKEVEAERSVFRKLAETKGQNLNKIKMEYNKLLANRFTGQKTDKGLDIENELPTFDAARFKELHDDWMKRDLELREQHIAAVVGDTVGDPLKDTSGPAINILVKLSAITSLVFGNYLAHYHVFGNQPKPIQYAHELVEYCNDAGTNPNTVDMVMKNCETWLKNGYFTYQDIIPAKSATKQTTADQPGIPEAQWKILDKAAENKA